MSELTAKRQLSKRMRYLAGGIAGALAATSLVVLGAVLDHGDGTRPQKVTLTADEAPAPNEPTVVAEDSTTTTTEAPPPTPEEVPGRIVAVEKRVTKLEASTTTTATAPPVDLDAQDRATCPGGGSLRDGTCKSAPPSTTTSTGYQDSRCPPAYPGSPPCPYTTPTTWPTLAQPEPTTSTTRPPTDEWFWYTSVYGQRYVELHVSRYRENPPIWNNGHPPTTLDVVVTTETGRTFTLPLRLNSRYSGTSGTSPQGVIAYVCGGADGSACPQEERMVEVVWPDYPEHRKPISPVVND